MKDIGTLIRAGILPHFIAASDRNVEHFRIMLGLSPKAIKEIAAGIAPFTPLKIDLLAGVMKLDAQRLADELERFSQEFYEHSVKIGATVEHPIYGDVRVLDYSDGLVKVQMPDGQSLAGIDSLTFADPSTFDLNLLMLPDETGVQKPFRFGKKKITYPSSVGTHASENSALSTKVDKLVKVIKTISETYDEEGDQFAVSASVTDTPKEDCQDQTWPTVFTKYGVEKITELSGLSKAEFGRKLGFHKDFIRGLTRGRKFPSDRFVGLSEFLGVDPDILSQIVLAKSECDLPNDLMSLPSFETSTKAEPENLYDDDPAEQRASIPQDSDYPEKDYLFIIQKLDVIIQKLEKLYKKLNE